MFIADETGVTNNQFLKLLSRGLTVPSSPLAEFVCCIKFKRTSPIEYSPLVSFTCIDHLEWGFINYKCLFNNKEKIETDLIRKINVVTFKKRQRTK